MLIAGVSNPSEQTLDSQAPRRICAPWLLTRLLTGRVLVAPRPCHSKKPTTTYVRGDHNESYRYPRYELLSGHQRPSTGRWRESDKSNLRGNILESTTMSRN